MAEQPTKVELSGTVGVVIGILWGFMFALVLLVVVMPGPEQDRQRDRELQSSELQRVVLRERYDELIVANQNWAKYCNDNPGKVKGK
jgi:hypothetical protein